MDEWKKTGSDRPYHYLGSAIWPLRMGRAFGETMIALMEPPNGWRQRSVTRRNRLAVALLLRLRHPGRAIA